MNIVLVSTPGSGCRSRGDTRLGPGGRRTLALNPATQSGRMDPSTSSRSNGCSWGLQEEKVKIYQISGSSLQEMLNAKSLTKDAFNFYGWYFLVG